MKRDPHQGQRTKEETGRWPRDSAARRGRDDGFGIDWGGEPKEPALPAPDNQVDRLREESMASEKKYGGLCKKCEKEPYIATTGPYAYLCGGCKDANRINRQDRKEGDKKGRGRERRKPAPTSRLGEALATDFDARLRQLVAAYDGGRMTGR